MKQKMFLFGLILAISLAFGTVVMAQTEGLQVEPMLVDEISGSGQDEQPPVETVAEAVPTLYADNVDGEAQDGIIIGGWDSVAEELDGVELDVPEEVPNGWGLFWRGVRERVAVAFTFDPVKKAEKQLQFAEERMAMAEKLSEMADNPQVQERVQAMVERAQALIDKAEEKKEKWLEKVDERSEKLLKNMATHQVRVQKALDRIESNIPEDKLDKWEELRMKAEEKSQNFVNALQAGNVPEQVKEHLQAVKDRIESHLETVKQYRDEKKDLLEAIKNGDESAQEELKALWEERKQTLEQLREEYKQKMEERKEKREELREASAGGDEEAQKQLQEMNKVENAVQNRVENRLENRQEKLEERADNLQEAVENGDEMAEKKLEMVEREQERVENRLEKIEDDSDEDRVSGSGGFGKNQ